MRQPVILSVINRALSGPINIHADHGDSMGARDAGWVQLYSENNQEAYDNLLMALRIGEDERVRLPVMVAQDGFIISHTIQTMKLEDDESVQNFIGPYKPVYPLLDVKNPISMGALDLQDYYIEHKRGQYEAIMQAKNVIKEIAEEFEKQFGRKYDYFENYMCDDAERVMVAINSAAGEIKEVVDELRRKGEKVGLLKIRVFRPFPYEEIREVLSGAQVVTVLDRSVSFGAYGPLFTEIRAAIYDLPQRPLCYNRIFGLGGRDLLMSDIESLFAESASYLEKGSVQKAFDFICVRGG